MGEPFAGGRSQRKKVTFRAAIESNNSIPRNRGSSVWMSPNVLRAVEAALKNRPANLPQYPYEENLVIVGQNVNVRKAAGTGAPVVGVVSNEMIRYDGATFKKLPQRMQDEFAIWNPNGWTPVILPNGKRGYIQNRYVYRPLGHRALFAKSGSKWHLRAFVSGD